MMYLFLSPRFVLALGLLLLTLSVRAVEAQIASITPDPFGISVRSGEVTDRSLSLANPTQGQLDWRLEALDANGRSPNLEGQLDAIIQSGDTLNGPLPARLDFTGGEAGTSSLSGGSNILTLGNRLLTNLGGPLVYTDNQVASSPSLGSNGRYFTRKMPGLFVFAAETDGIQWFEVAGSLAFGNAKQSSSFRLSHTGVNWSAFVVNHSDYWRTINHLVLVDQGGLQQITGANGSQQQRITGLSGKRRIYHFLYLTTSTAVQPQAVFETLATRFLDLLPSFGSRLSFSPAAGSTPPLASAASIVTFDAVALPEGSYTGTIRAVSPTGTALAAVPLDVQVTAPRLAAPASVERMLFPGQVAETLELPLTSTLPDPQSWTAALESPAAWLTVANESGTTPESLRLRLDPAGLAPGTHTSIVVVRSGAATFRIPVRLQIRELAIRKFVVDPDRPVVYAVNQNGKDPGEVLEINTVTQAITRSVRVGKEPSDLDLTENGDQLVVMNTSGPSLSVVDLASFTVAETIPLTEFSNRNDDVGGHVKCGKGSIVYYVDEQWGPRLRVFDTATKTVLQTLSAQSGTSPDTSNNYGYGDINLTPDRSFLFGWVQYGDGAGWAGTAVVRFAAGQDGRLSGFARSADYYQSSNNFLREPFDSPVLLSRDGTRLIIKGREVDRNQLDVHPISYPKEIYSISPGGEIAVSSTAIYAGEGGEILHSLPVTTTVQTVLPDYSALVYFNATAKSLGWLDLPGTLGTARLGLELTPADGATVVQPSLLKWLPVTGVTRYQVYLGTSRSEVESATTTAALYLGMASGNEMALGGGLTVGQTYYWRVVPVDAGGVPVGEGTVHSFSVSSMTLSRSSVAAETVQDVTTHVETIQLESAVPQAWTATESTAWIKSVSEAGTTPGTLTIEIDASGLAAGTYQGAVTVTSAGSQVAVPVSLRVYAANFVIADADLDLPYVYLVSQADVSSTQPSFLLRLNTATDKIESAIRCGSGVTDLAVHYLENRIYLTNWKTGVLRAFDRTTFAQVQTYQFAPLGPTGYGEGGIWRISAGKAGRLIIEESDQWIDIRLINTANGAVLATQSSEYAGDGEADPLGRYYYHSEMLSSDSLTRYDLSADSFVKMPQSGNASAGTVVMIPDGSRLAVGPKVFDADLLLQFTLPANVLAATLHGDLLFTSNKAYNGVTGLEQATLPANTTVMSVSGDQKKLYQFPANTAAFQTVALSTIATLPSRSLAPAIADGATVIGTSQELGWSIEPVALSYDVYFGTSAAAVAAATKTSPEFLGNTSGRLWNGALPGLSLGGEYFWRVDVNGFASTTKGETWSFQIASVDVVPRRVEIAAPIGAPVPRQTLELTSPTPLAWTATSSTPWIIVATPSGSTPGTLRFDISTAGLSVGAKSGSITVESAGQTFSIPVELSVVTLNVTQLVAHPQRPVVYAINTALSGEGFSHLLELDAATAAIRRTIPIGFAPTDADLDAASGRLYISNWGYDQTRVIDVDAWRELPPLNLGTDIYKLEITPDGRLVTEGEDEWVQLKIWDAASGENLASSSSPYLSVRGGDGQADPTGSYYYHSDNNSSGAVVTKYDIRSNSFVTALNGPQIGYGSRNLILSGDGSRLFWLGQVMDAELNILSQMPSGAEIHATNHSGALAVTDGKVFWSDSATEVASLAFTSTVGVFSADDAHLLRFNATTRTLHSIPVSSITDLPGPTPRPGQLLAVSPTEISWSPVAGAVSYRFFLAGSSAALGAMTGPTGIVTSRFYQPAAALDFGRFHFWRADAVTADGTVIAGKVQSFGISYPAGPPLDGDANLGNGIAASISDRHLLVGLSGSAQLYDFDPDNGVSTKTQRFTLSGSSSNHNLGAAVAMDAGKAAAGAPSFANPASSGGAAFVYRQSESGYWENSGPLAPPSPVASEQFGSGLAASGNLMLAGTGNTTSGIGRVCAYITEPGLTRTQTFSAGDGVAGDAFGRVIAMRGNHAVIAAPGRGTSFNRLPSLYAFNRSTSTGQWQQSQKVAIPGATTSTIGIRSIALFGNLMATNVGTTGVAIFSRNSSGQWIHLTTIERSSVANSSGSFGSGLALVGDQLFIGDPAATHQGTSGGVVFSFHRSGSNWIAGPAIVPQGTRSNFGNALAVRDRWLLAAGGNSQPGFLFQVSGTENRTPHFIPGMPTQVVAGRVFSAPLSAADADGNGGLVIDKLQGPAWLGVIDNGQGQARVGGMPTGTSGDSHTVQFRVRDTAGAEALHTYQLTLLAPTDLPVLASSPLAADLGVGQELVLRASVSGIGPFQWQWFKDGQAIEGATASTYIIGEVGLGNAGSYQVKVSNIVGSVESAAVNVSVHPADRYAGDWLTFGGSPAHAGRHPAALDSTLFQPAWTAQLQSGKSLNRAAISGGRAVVVPNSGHTSGIAVKAVDLETGGQLWSYPFPTASSSNPPSIHAGRVYFQRGNHASDTQVICLDTITGGEIWKAPFAAQWQTYESPAVTDLGVFINGGSYGGMYGFNFDGSQRFFATLAQVDRWTPTIHQGRLFTWTNGSFIEHNPFDGSTNWSLTNLSGTGVIAAQENSAVIRSNGLTCIDLPTRKVRWQLSGTFGQPAIGDDRVFAIQSNAVRSYSLSDGSPNVTYQTDTPSSTLIEQPILFNDRLVISSETKTWIFNLQDGALLQTLDVGGRLSYSNGYLLAAGSDGVLRGFIATPHGRIAVKGPAGEALANNLTAVRVGAPPVGASSLTEITLRNTGLADLGGFAWTFEGEHAADFSVTGNPAKIVLPGAETPLGITFKPTAKGRREAVLVLSSDDPTAPEFRIPLFALPPSVDALAATGRTGVSAILNGSVTANDNEVTVSYEYGLTPEFGTTVDASPISLSGADESPVSATISGLPPGTLHHYRVGATNAHGTHWSGPMTFTTLSDNAKLGQILPLGSLLSPLFHPERFHYITSVAFSGAFYQLRAFTAHPGARMRINGIPVQNGIMSPPLPLKVGNNAITTVVTAEDGITTLSYTIGVTRLPEFFVLSPSGTPPVSADGFAITGPLIANLRLQYHPSVGTSLMLVENTSLSPIHGEFRNLKQGQRITLQHEGVDYDFIINYYGGTGNDLVLQWADTFAVAWGQNNQGQLGNGTTVNAASPVAVELPAGVLASKTLFSLSAGYLHSLALLHDGTVAAWGYNNQGQLGLGHQNSSHLAGRVDNTGALAGKRVIALAAGAFHNLALCSDGTLVSWGMNNHGQLGTGDRQTRLAPALVAPLGALTGKRVVAIAAGFYHSLALCDDGTVAAWGYNDEGELGDGSTTTALLPVAVDASDALAGKSVTRISAGQYHSLALCQDGTLVAWGYNARGQLGDGTTTDRHSPVLVDLTKIAAGGAITTVSAGGSHNLVKLTDGSLAGWGDNARGQLDAVAGSRLTVPQLLAASAGRGFSAGALHTLSERNAETIDVWGDPRAASSAVITLAADVINGGSRLVAASTGAAAFHSLAIVAQPGQVGMPTSALAEWREQHFGSSANEDEAADCYDCDHDGIPNLVEYAFGLDPYQHSAGKIPQPQRVGERLELRFSRLAIPNDVICGAEWSPDLSPGSWRDIPDSGSGGEHLFSLPVDTAPNRFMRLKVTPNSLPQ